MLWLHEMKKEHKQRSPYTLETETNVLLIHSYKK